MAKAKNVTTRSMKVTIGEKGSTPAKKPSQAVKKPQAPPSEKKVKKEEVFKPYPQLKSKSEPVVIKRKEIHVPEIGKRKGYRRPITEYLLIIILGVVILGGAGTVGWSMTRKAIVPDEMVAFTIEAGMSATEVSRLLEDVGIIANQAEFLSYVIEHDATMLLHTGTFILAKNSPAKEILSALSSRGKEMELLIYPGYTLMQIDDLLVSRIKTSPGSFIKAANDVAAAYHLSFAEGWLLGGTYSIEVGPHSSEELALKMFLASEEMIQSLSDSPLLNEYSIEELIIIASMIQAETQDSSQMEGIASVIHNRLKKKEPLGIDATTRYELGDWQNPIPQKALEEHTPYNTRRRVGLPPTGIAAPSKDALYAAFYPANTPNFYYLHGFDKAIHYAVDYEGHLKNIELYRK